MRALTLLCVFAVFNANLFGQISSPIVHDPGNATILMETKSETLMKWAEQLKKYEDMIKNQLDTIKSVTSLQTQLTARIGDWNGVFNGALDIKDELLDIQNDLKHPLKGMAILDWGQQTVMYENHGIYVPIKLETPDGKSFVMADNLLKRFGEVEARYEQYYDSEQQLDKDIADLKKKIADTSNLALNGKTQAEVEKYKVKLDIYENHLNVLLTEQRMRADRVIIQKTLNDNQKEKEAIIMREKNGQTSNEQWDKANKAGTGGKF